MTEPTRPTAYAYDPLTDEKWSNVMALPQSGKQGQARCGSENYFAAATCSRIRATLRTRTRLICRGSELRTRNSIPDDRYEPVRFFWLDGSTVQLWRR